MFKRFAHLVRADCRLPMFACFCLIVITGISWKSFFIDDAYIGFRCIENFLAGNGFVFNIGARVESVTNIGWLLLLTPLAKFISSPVAGKLAGAFLLLVSAWLVCSMGAEIDKCSSSESGSFMRYLVPLTTFSGSALLYFSHSGMETALVCALIASAFYLIEHPRRLFWVAIIYSVAYSVRPECILLFPCFFIADKVIATEATTREDGNIRLNSLLIWAAGIFCITLARYAYFGDIFPNTFYAKPASSLGVLIRLYKFLIGNSVNLPGPFAGLFVIPLIFLGFQHIKVVAQRLLPICFAGAATGVAFAVYSSDDWTTLPRYFAPYSPFYLFFIFAGLQELVCMLDKTGKKVAAIFMGFVFLFFLLNNLVDQVRWFGQPVRDKYPGYVLVCKPLMEPALDMSRLLQKSAVVATRRIGLIGYLSQCEIFDYTFGLPDKELVAARKSVGGRAFDDPTDIGLMEIWKRRRPAYFLEDRSRIKKMLNIQDNVFSEFAIHGIKYREIRAYKLGDNEDWVLCAAVLP